jgi:hypothetical protein
MTMATDYLLVVFCLFLGLSLWKKAGPSKPKAVVLWIGAFFVTAWAALVGGTAHGFKLYLGETGHATVWSTTLVSIGFSAAFLIAAGLVSGFRPTTTSKEKRKTGHRSLKRAIAVTVIGLVIQQSGLGLHVHFNHNDIYHIIQMVGLYYLYRGALNLHDLVD